MISLKASGGKHYPRLVLLTALFGVSLTLIPAELRAQQLDLDDNYIPKHTSVQAIRQPTNAGGQYSSMPSGTMGKPLSVSISKTLYLPPAMYGQWSITGILLETNLKDFFSPTVNDIWILQREGDQVVVSNPANGASAAVNVDRVEGNEATFHREGTAGRNRYFQETPTITVKGDFMSGRSVNKLYHLKDGVVTKEFYAIYQLQAERISGGRVTFRPEASMGDGPDFEIEEVQRR